MPSGGRTRPAHRASGPRHGRPPSPDVREAPHLLLSGLASLILTAIVAVAGFFVFAEGARSRADVRTPPPGPLTVADVFATSPYAVQLSHWDANCASAVTGELATVLRDTGCAQVVRAALQAPYGDYRVTAGVFTLGDAPAARDAADRAQILVEHGRGGFGQLIGPPGQASWQPRGQYLLYCVISRPGGGVVPDDDPDADRITAELFESLLGTS
ncbi:hypothetical protein [Symbioplanes lichenis]|uniref:hypothetical protein n=1 Tax=Symbioplanes lichenis TaxID=1629072 RepID=UPI002739A7D2|nr:hypothetical protein [Actinoplanes lichenis]